MITPYTSSIKFFWKLKQLSDAIVVPMSTKEYGFAVHFLMKWCVQFSLICFGIAKDDCVMKTR